MESLNCNENCFECEHLINGNVDEHCPSKMNFLIMVKIARKINELEQKINLLVEGMSAKIDKKKTRVENKLLNE